VIIIISHAYKSHHKSKHLQHRIIRLKREFYKILLQQNNMT